MKKKRIRKVAFIILCAAMLSGCSAFKKLDDPYVFTQRTALYEECSLSGRAEGFAHDLCIVTDDAPSGDPSITAEAAAVFDISHKKVVFEKNPFEKLYPASITKIMTALLVVKYGNLSDEVTVTEASVITELGATLCGIKPGDKLTMEQLLYGLMLPSGNDAGAAIAVHMDGGIDQFADRMNEEAKKLGATGSHFVNPHGLHFDDHYTTAYDLYLILNEAMKYPEFNKVIATDSYDASYTALSGSPVKKTWKQTNLYMTGEREMPDGLIALGGKTGTTQAAKSCLIMACDDAFGSKYISVVLKAPDRKDLYDDMSNILNKIAD